LRLLPQQFLPALFRRVSTARPAGKGGAKSKGAGISEEPVSMDDLLPRADISGQITSSYVANLTSTNWKERKAALDELEQILAGAGNRIQPAVSSSPSR
jgi:cytoskeleton-associated protein 5